jgi:hypothetical protein
MTVFQQCADGNVAVSISGCQRSQLAYIRVIGSGRFKLDSSAAKLRLLWDTLFPDQNPKTQAAQCLQLPPFLPGQPPFSTPGSGETTLATGSKTMPPQNQKP